MFKIGNFYYPDGGGSFWENLLISLISSGLGVLFAWLIFKKTIQNNLKEDKEKRENYLKERMKFLSLLLQEVITNSHKQIDNYVLNGKEIIENPYDFHLVQFLASNQLIRLKEIDSQDVFVAFMLLFDSSEETVKKYNGLLNQIDFLQNYLDQTLDSSIKNIKSVSTDQEKMRIAIDVLYSNFPKYCKDSEMNQIWDHYIEKFNLYIQNPPFNIKDFHENFLIPLFKDVTQIVTENIENQGDFIYAIRNVTTIIEHYKVNNKNYAETVLLLVKDEINECLKELQIYNLDIKNKLNGIL